MEIVNLAKVPLVTVHRGTVSSKQKRSLGVNRRPLKIRGEETDLFIESMRQAAAISLPMTAVYVQAKVSMFQMV